MMPTSRYRIFWHLCVTLTLLISNSSSQSCSNADIGTLQTCSDPAFSILTTIVTDWPIPVPLPSINNSMVNKLCTAYKNYTTCLAPRNSTCGNSTDAINLVSVAGYLCVDQFTLFSSKSDCIQSFLASPNDKLTKCIQSAQQIQFYKLMDTDQDSCNAYKDSASCVYPLVQAQCGQDVGNALFEFSRRVIITAYPQCQIAQCFNNTNCMYDQTCRSGRTCECVVQCPQQTSSQCASDSHVYDNSCLIRKQSCVQKSWLLTRPMEYCNRYNNNTNLCTDTVMDQYAHCAIPMYTGTIAFFRKLDTFLHYFTPLMINKTCDMYKTYVNCTSTTPTPCVLPNGPTMNEFYQKYMCTDAGYSDLVNNADCWSIVGDDFQFQQCSQDFTVTVDSLPYYNDGSYVDSFISDFGGVCTALNDLGTCTIPRVQALCKSSAVDVFMKVFRTYRMFMVNCNTPSARVLQPPVSQCPTGWFAFSQYCYYVSPSPVDEPTSEDGCKAVNPTAVVASIHSDDERRNIEQLMVTKSVSSVWIGGRDDQGTFRWIDQTPFDYKAWGSGQPGSQRCFLQTAALNYQWQTADCFATTAAYVCKMAQLVNCNVVNPCQNGGTCVTTNGVGSCICPSGLSGTICTTIASCNPNPCQNGGVCQTTSGVSSCTCPAGFNGTICSNSAACNSNPCQNGGQCIASPAGYRCSCALGFNGTNCQNATNNCNNNPCLNGGTCYSLSNGYVCGCLPAFTGVNCQISSSPCSSNPCQNGGTCFPNSNGFFRCLCSTGFTGPTCNTQTPTDFCASSPCLNSGTCFSNTSGFQCGCVNGFSGITCNIQAPNNCLPNPCQNGGTCFNTTSGSGFVCNCMVGFTGTICNIQTPTNFCASNPCFNGGTCTSTTSGYFCTCPTGFTGTICNIQTPTNFCASNPCFNGGTCTSTTSGYFCTCPTGFTGAQCQTTNNFCSSNPCRNNGICQSTATGYICSCSGQFSGSNCELSPTTSTCSAFPCLNGATCIMGTTGYFCQCASGYYGLQCSQSSAVCNSNPCMNGGSCIDLNGAYTCKCQPNFSGTQCQYPNSIVCSTNSPCLNGGVCSYSLAVTVCSCSSTFQGPTCAQIGSNQCANFPCQNGGTCISGINYFLCLCPSSFIGLNCQIPAIVSNPCASNPCQNGQCSVTTSGFICTCNTGWSGTFCNLPSTVMCSPSPCQNGGQCIVISSTEYLCRCPGGWLGSNCNTDQNECLLFPCKNNGVCVNTVGSYYCTCAAGYQGTDCSQYIGGSGSCAVNNCANGGTCTASSTTSVGYTCTCPPEYTGSTCNFALCTSGWKFNGGYCYMVYPSTVTEPMAKQTCASSSSQLVSIHDTPERDFVASLMTKNNVNRAWIGAEYSASNSFWSWVDQSAWSYSSWGTSQPTNPSSFTCAHQIVQNGVNWETESCSGSEATVCKTMGKIVASGIACNPNPCQNSGTCVATNGGYTCQCPAGFGGTNCISSTGSCQTSQCFNGGTCKGVGNTYVCACTNGYTVQSNCRLPCPLDWTYFMGKCYLAMNNAVSYNAAVASCPAQQSTAKLLYVESETEFYFAATLANKLSSNIWLGMMYDTSTSKHQWVSGMYLNTGDYQAWGLNQPSNPSINKCVQIIGFRGFTWETYDCTLPLKYVCKWDGST